MSSESFKNRIHAFMAMSDSKTKPTAKGPAPRSVKDSKLWSLICLAREVAGDVDGINEYSDLVEEKRKLEQQLKESSHEASRLSSELTQHRAGAAKEVATLTSAFGEQYKIFHQNHGALESYRRQIDEAKTEIQALKGRDASRQRQLMELEATFKSTKSVNDRLQRKSEAIEKENVMHRSQLQAIKAERDGLQMKLDQAREDLGQASFHELDGSRQTEL